MSNITKKQATLAVIAVVFATAMIVSVIASSDSVYATHGKKSKKSISIENEQNQKSKCVTAGGGSSITDSCKNSSFSTTSNTGGNA